MIKRNKRVYVRLSEKEFNKLSKSVRKSGLSRESYIRNVINGIVPNELPPIEYHRMMNELRTVAKELRAISDNAYENEDKFYEKYKAEIDKLNEIIVELTRAVLLPRKED